MDPLMLSLMSFAGATASILAAAFSLRRTRHRIIVQRELHDLALHRTILEMRTNEHLRSILAKRGWDIGNPLADPEIEALLRDIVLSAVDDLKADDRLLIQGALHQPSAKGRKRYLKKVVEEVAQDVPQDVAASAA